MSAAGDSEASQTLRSLLNIGGGQGTASAGLLPGMDPAILSAPPAAFPAEVTDAAPVSTWPPAAGPEPLAQRAPLGPAFGLPPGLPPGLMLHTRLPGVLQAPGTGADGPSPTRMPDGAAPPPLPSVAGDPPPQRRLAALR